MQSARLMLLLAPFVLWSLGGCSIPAIKPSFQAGRKARTRSKRHMPSLPLFIRKAIVF